MADTEFSDYVTPVPAAWLNDVNDHVYNDTPVSPATTVHDASVIANTPAGTIVAVTVQAAIDELDTDVSDHTSDTVGAHAATAISNTPAGSIAATTIQAAIDELDTEKAALAGSATQDFSTQNLTTNGRQDLKTGANIASAATINLATATGNLVHITGTTPTSAITMTSGQWMRCIADAAWPLTYHATTNRISGGVDYTCAVGDTIDYFYDGTTVIGNITKKDGTAVVDVDVGITLGTAVAATSGTSIDFTGIPATAKRVTLVLAGVSTNGTSPFIVQIGDAGGIEVTGYTSGAGSRTAEVASTIGFILNQVGSASSTYTAVIPITLFDTNSWATSGALNRVSDGFAQTFGGQKTLSGTLDRVRLTTVNGTDTFDAGTVNITYES